MILPRTKKHLGQHFLHDQNIIDQIVGFINPKKSKSLVEIGPGAGALTVKLLPEVDRLDVIELDKDIIPILKINCDDSPKLHIHNEDVLKTDFTKFDPPIRLVGNLPYNISTPLLFHIIKNIEKVEDMHFMLQKEVAERIVAKPSSKTYGRLSVMIQYFCETKMLLKIGSGAFSPPPKVDSAFIKFVPHKSFVTKAMDENKFAEIVREAFNHRRKTIANSLKKYISASELEEIGIDPKARPEQLSVKDFVLIGDVVSDIEFELG